MEIPGLRNLRCCAHQVGQGTTELIIIAAVVAVCSIFVYTQFGDVLRNQTAASAKALAGESGGVQTSSAQYAANQAAMGTSGWGMGNFSNPGLPLSPGSPSPSPGSPPAPSPGDPSPNEPGGPSPGEGESTVEETISSSTLGDSTVPPSPPSTPSAYATPLDNPTIDAIISMSPTLRAAVDEMTSTTQPESKRWKFIYNSGINGEGQISQTKVTALFPDGSQYVTYIDRKIEVRNSGSPTERQVGTIAHEVGHAKGSSYDSTALSPSISKDDFVKNCLKSEGEAVVFSMIVRQEILNANGPDIGFSGSQANLGEYQAIAEKLKNNQITKQEAIDKVADLYKNEMMTINNADGTVGTMTYENYYKKMYTDELGGG